MRESILEYLRAPLDGSAPGTDRSLKMHVLSHTGEQIETGVLVAADGRWWWIERGVPRLLPPALYRSASLERSCAADLRRLGLALPAVPRTRRTLEHSTIDRFGAEWLMFRDWGYLDELPPGRELEHKGGLWSETQRAFRLKTFLDGRLDGKLVLDAGCGNGRFTRAALDQGAGAVLGVDLGWGVEAAHFHHRDDPRVHIIQASLLDLPIGPVEAAFSLGVLMHTGDAPRAFAAVAACVEPGGLFGVRLYHKGNGAYETLDRSIRAVTTRLPKWGQRATARGLALVGRGIHRLDRLRPGFGARAYAIVHHWPTIHHNLDWWSAPVATHHTTDEVCQWAGAAGLELIKADPGPGRTRYGFFEWPESLTALFARPVGVDAPRRADANDATGCADTPTDSAAHELAHAGDAR